MATRYYVGLNGTREPHPLSPEGGFMSAALAVLWAIQHDILPVWWPMPETGSYREIMATKICENVEILTESGCWIWMKGISNDGYPVISAPDKTRRAHRVSYEVFNGSFDKSLMVCHRCDVPSCVNPDHLFLGTNGDNMRDAVAKGRHRNQHTGKTHCSNGHEFNEKNTRIYHKRVGWQRICRECEKNRHSVSYDEAERDAQPARLGGTL